MIARDSQATDFKRRPGTVAWRDMGRDWQRWSAAERFGAPLLLAGMAALIWLARS